MSGDQIKAAIESIVDAVGLVDVSQLEYVGEIAVWGSIGGEVEPPAVVVGLPVFRWESICEGPSSMEVPVFVVVDKTDRAPEQLYQLVPAVAAAIDLHAVDAAAREAEPSLFPVGSRELPAYGITVHIDL